MVLRLVRRVFERWKLQGETASENAQSEQSRQIRLVIGLDFGTSFSKIVIGEERVRYVVPFNQLEDRETTFLVPSALCVLPDNTCRLGTKCKEGRLFTNLKLPLIERDFSDEVRICATAYIALLLNHARSWLLENHRATYADRKIEWFVNVGLPTDSFDDEELRSVYLSIIQDAWHMSEQEGDVSMAFIEEFVKKGGQYSDTNTSQLKEHLPRDRFNAFPEFLAHLAGYVGTPRRREDLHVTIDIGGGTFDLTVFKVVPRKDDEDEISIYERVVEPLGVRNLIESRISSICSAVKGDYSMFEDLPSDGEFGARFGLSEKEVNALDRGFERRLRKVITSTLRYTKIERYPTAPQWHDPGEVRYGEPLPSFFCGGGSLSNFYASFLNTYNHPNPPFSLEELELPVPENLEPRQTSTHEFARLAVAYGLAIDPLNMTDFQHKAQIDDMKAPRSHKSFREHYVGNEQT